MPSLHGLQVIVLAAGEGQRLGASGNGHAKALLPLAGRTLVQRAIDLADRLRATRVIVVGGKDYAAVQASVNALRRPEIRVVDNPAFRSGNLLSLRAALPHVDGPVLLTNVDHVFPRDATPLIAAAMGDDIAAYCQFARTLADDEMKVELDDARNIRRMSKALAQYDGGYIGLTYVPPAQLRSWIDAIERVAECFGDAAVAEHALQQIADQGDAVRAVSLDGITWSEIDTPADYVRAQAPCAAGAL